MYYLCFMVVIRMFFVCFSLKGEQKGYKRGTKGEPEVKN